MGFGRDEVARSRVGIVWLCRDARAGSARLLYPILGYSEMGWKLVSDHRLTMKPPRTPDYALFLQELREARAQTDMTQVQLAQALGQLQTYVSKCELGDRRLDVIELRAWVMALGGDPVAFVASLEDRLARNSGVRSTLQVTSTPTRRTGGSRRRSSK